MMPTPFAVATILLALLAVIFLMIATYYLAIWWLSVILRHLGITKNHNQFHQGREGHNVKHEKNAS